MKTDGQKEVAGNPSTVPTIDGRRLIIRPLSPIEDIAFIREESLNRFRRERIKVWTKNTDLMREAGMDVQAEVRDAMLRAESLTEDDLPEKQVIEYQVPKLDNGEDDPDFDITLIPKRKRTVKAKHYVPYHVWWMSDTEEGMVFALWLSAKSEPSQSEITLDQIKAMFRTEDGALDEGLLDVATHRLGKATQGNSDAPQDGAEEKRQERKRRRRRRNKQTG